MSELKLNTVFAKLAAIAVFAAALGVSLPAAAQHKANENDMEVPTNDMKVVEAGQAWFARRCSFCHGTGGHGAKGPCLSCGVFKYSGNTNSEIYVTIAAGVPKTIGGTMGAFGTTMNQDEILSVITYLRWEEKRRIEAGEIPDPYKNKNEEPMVFPK
ncbi:MAG: c-type cytochrome [Betaproteobacteria bacterium]